MNVSIITPCKGRLSALKQTLRNNAALDGVEYVLVDYACPEGAADWVEAQGIQNVVVVRAKPDNEYFNHSKSRNIGAKAAHGKWLMFVDADVLLSSALEIEKFCIDGLFCDGRASECFGLILVRAIDFWNAGGYLETLNDWGGDDTCLKWCLQKTGLRRRSLPYSACLHIEPNEDLRTIHFQEKSFATSSHRNLKIIEEHLAAATFRHWSAVPERLV